MWKKNRFSIELEKAGLKPLEFSKKTGTPYDTVKSWCSNPDLTRFRPAPAIAFAYLKLLKERKI